MSADITGILLALMTGVVILGGYLIASREAQRKKRSAELTGRIINAEDIGDDADELLDQNQEKSALAEMLDGVLMLILPLTGKNLKDEQAKLKKKMQHAGITSPDGPTYYLFYQYVLSIVFAIIGFNMVMNDADGMVFYQKALLGIIVMVVGIFGAKLYVKNATDKRKKVLTRSFPDALDLMLVCVESGLALDAALARVCKELGAAHPLITTEFNRVRLELSLLNDRSKALYGLGERTDIVAFRALAAALIQSEKFGTSLSDTLRVMSDDFRQTRLMVAEEKANSLPAKMTVPLICFLLPALFIIILSPAFIKIANQGGFFGNGD